MAGKADSNLRKGYNPKWHYKCLECHVIYLKEGNPDPAHNRQANHFCGNCFEALLAKGHTFPEPEKITILCPGCGLWHAVGINYIYSERFNSEVKGSCRACGYIRSSGKKRKQPKTDKPPKMVDAECLDKSRINCRSCEDRPNCPQSYEPLTYSDFDLPKDIPARPGMATCGKCGKRFRSPDKARIHLCDDCGLQNRYVSEDNVYHSTRSYW